MLGETRTVCPFPYQGSKRRCAPDVISYFPSGFKRLIEPFAGSAAISIAVARLGLAKEFWINDANVQLMRLWRVILLNPDGLCDAYKTRWDAQKEDPIAYYKFIQRRYFLHRRAADLLFLLYRSANSIVRFNMVGGFSNTSRPDNPGCMPTDVRARITSVHKLLAGVTTVTSIDYGSVISCADGDDLIYMDPPYHDPHRGRGNYIGSFDHERFCVQLERLNERNVPYILSYGNRERDAMNGRTFDRSLRLTYIKIMSRNIGLLSGDDRDNVSHESLYVSRSAMSRLCSSPNMR